MSNTEAFLQPAAPSKKPESAFFPISIAALRLDEATAFDLYVSQGVEKPPVLYRGGATPFLEENRARLQEHGVASLLVSKDQREQYLAYLERHLSQIVDDPAVPQEQKSVLVYDSAVGLVQGLMEEERVGDYIHKTAHMADNYVRFLRSSDRALPQLIKVMSFDYYTYTHSINVFTFSLSLAIEADIQNDDIVRFGQGVLVHDIGKRRVGAEILNHRGKLSPEQWDIMRKHPEFGVEILTEEGASDEIMLDVTLHHHEKLTGKGYPEALPAKDISVWARICAIADIFDALTTRRSYKNAHSSFESLQLMLTEMRDELDQNLFRTFVRMIGAKK